MKKFYVNFLLNSLDEKFLLLDSSFRIVDLNIKAFRKMGFQVGRNSIGSKFQDVFPDEIGKEKLVKYKEVLKTGVSASFDNVVLENSAGKRFIDIHVYKVGEELCLIVKDVTKQRHKEIKALQINEQLIKLNSRLHTVREEERKAISREIHDTLGQDLTGIKFELVWIKRNLSEDQPLIKEKIDELISTVDETIDEVKKITAMLRLEFLESHSLQDAIRIKTEQFSRNTGIEVSHSIEAYDIEIGNRESIVFYRILQESLTNIVRHAKATKIEVVFTAQKNNITFLIRDNGIGIKEHELHSPLAYGIIGMRERCSYIGGKLDINGNDGIGTTVKVELSISV